MQKEKMSLWVILGIVIFVVLILIMLRIYRKYVAPILNVAEPFVATEQLIQNRMLTNKFGTIQVDSICTAVDPSIMQNAITNTRGVLDDYLPTLVSKLSDPSIAALVSPDAAKTAMAGLGLDSVASSISSNPATTAANIGNLVQQNSASIAQINLYKQVQLLLGCPGAQAPSAWPPTAADKTKLCASYMESIDTLWSIITAQDDQSQKANPREFAQLTHLTYMASILECPTLNAKMLSMNVIA